MESHVQGAPADIFLTISRVAIIGAGAAGRDFAQACLRAGVILVLEDVMPANLRRAEADLLDPGGLLTLASTVEDAVREADLAIDFVPDELESKLEIFSMIDRMAPPRTILCTPTETLSITDLASCVYRPDRCLALRGLPFATPSSEGASLDLLHSRWTSASAIAATEQFLEHLGFHIEVGTDPDAPALVKNSASPLS